MEKTNLLTFDSVEFVHRDCMSMIIIEKHIYPRDYIEVRLFKRYNVTDKGKTIYRKPISIENAKGLIKKLQYSTSFELYHIF